MTTRNTNKQYTRASASGTRNVPNHRGNANVHPYKRERLGWTFKAMREYITGRFNNVQAIPIQYNLDCKVEYIVRAIVLSDTVVQQVHATTVPVHAVLEREELVAVCGVVRDGDLKLHPNTNTALIAQGYHAGSLLAAILLFDSECNKTVLQDGKLWCMHIDELYAAVMWACSVGLDEIRDAYLRNS